MPPIALFFYDHKSAGGPDVVSAAVASANGSIEFKPIKFFSSNLDDLALISRHRVVSLPTFILVNDKDILMRVAGRMPTNNELMIMKGMYDK